MAFIVTIIMSIIWLIFVPFALGLPVAKRLEEKEHRTSLVFLCGMFVSIGMFQVCFVPFLLFYNQFTPFVWVIGTILLASSCACICVERKYAVEVIGEWKQLSIRKPKSLIPWIITFGLIGIQLYYTAFYQFLDGDDAYYLPISLATQWLEKMYFYLPYTGYTTEFDIRHAFSGAPIYVGFLARVCMTHSAIIYRVILPILLVIVMYIIYTKIARELYEDKPENVPIFVGVIALLYLFGNTSIYTQATFALTRTAQGKAVISNIVIPFIAYVLLRLHKKLRAELPYGVEMWLLTLATLMGGFATMLGLALIPMMTAIGLFLLALMNKKWKLILWQIPILLPTYILGVIYLCLA